jgi:quercetin dioxygenase-like cupin family protein
VKRMLSALAVTAALIGMFAVTSAATTEKATIVMPGSIKWIAGTGEDKGTFYAPLYGDPKKAGAEYAYRLKVPAGTKFPPHVHGRLEQVTVISGTFLAGLGSKWDASKMVTLGPGSFAAMPANVPHYAVAKTEVVLELHGIGPESMTMLKGGM